MAIAALCALVSAIALLVQNRKGGAGTMGLLTLVFGFLWFYTGSTIAVAPNKAVVVVNQGTGKPEAQLRYPGIQSVPWFFRDTFEYPYQSDWQWCPILTPSVKGGAGVTVNVCFTIDSTQINWAEQYARYNGGLDVITTAWQTEITQGTANATALFVPRDLTDNRNAVVEEIRRQTADAFEKLHVLPHIISLKTWQFTDKDLEAAYDQAFLSQTKIDQANFELQAAEIQQKTAGIQADTQVEVAQKLANGHLTACIIAKMTTSESCIAYLQLIWLNSQKANNLVVSVGGGNNPSVTFPAQTQAAP